MLQGNNSRWFYAYLPSGMSGGATSALIPLFAYALGGNLAEVGIIAAATSIASVPAFVLWGLLSDHLGRRKLFLLLGFAGSAISFAAMAVTSTMRQFYLTNLLLGFLGAAAGPVGAVLVMETASRKQWPARLALMSRIGGIGWVAGLILGVVWLFVGPAFVGEIGAMRALFAIGAALGVLSAVLVAAWLAEPRERVERRGIHVADLYHRIERVKFLPMRMLHYVDPRNHHPRGHLSRPFRVYLLSVFLLFAGFTAFYGFFPILLRQAYDLSNPQVFAVFIASQVASTLLYVRVGKWVQDRGGRPMLIYASLARCVLFPAFLFLAFLPVPALGLFGMILALHAGVGACWAVINVASTTIASGLAPENMRAEALGAFNAMQGFGAILGPLVGGFAALSLGYGFAIVASVTFIAAGTGILVKSRGSSAEIGSRLPTARKAYLGVFPSGARARRSDGGSRPRRVWGDGPGHGPGPAREPRRGTRGDRGS